MLTSCLRNVSFIFSTKSSHKTIPPISAVILLLSKKPGYFFLIHFIFFIFYFFFLFVFTILSEIKQMITFIYLF